MLFLQIGELHGARSLTIRKSSLVLFVAGDVVKAYSAVCPIKVPGTTRVLPKEATPIFVGVPLVGPRVVPPELSFLMTTLTAAVVPSAPGDPGPARLPYWS